MSLNVELLRKIQQHILAEPLQFQMADIYADADDINWSGEDLPRKKIPNCGTAACIAGWAIALNERTTPSEVRNDGRRVINLDEVALLLGARGYRNLFIVSGWPKPFRERWYRTLTHEGRAQVAVDRIEALIRADARKRKARKAR